MPCPSFRRIRSFRPGRIDARLNFSELAQHFGVGKLLFRRRRRDIGGHRLRWSGRKPTGSAAIVSATMLSDWSIASSRRAEHVGVRNPMVGVFFQKLHQNAIQFLGRIGGIASGSAPVSRTAAYGASRAATCRGTRAAAPAGRTSTRPDCTNRPGCRRLSLGLLGGHVFGRAQHVARARQPSVSKQPGDAEVGKFHAAVGRQQQIARLDVAMDDAAIVGVPQARQVSMPIRVTSRQSKRRPCRSSSSRLLPSTNSIA